MSNAWNDIEVSATGGKYLKLKEGANKIRIVSDPLIVYKHFDRENEITEVYLTAEAASSREDTTKRVMMYVIDRTDGAVKQAEFPASVARDLKEIATNAEYGVTEAVWPRDVTINRKGSGLETRYTVMPSPNASALTAAETVLVGAMEPLFDVVKKDAMDGDRV